MVYDNNNYPLYQQNGGKVETDINSKSYTGPSINVSDKTIKMKIGLVKSENDDTLPSYLVPILDCAKGDKSPASQTTSSSVMVTLSGNNLLQVTDTTSFTCEITSNFLTGTEKSAITIETYYQDSANAIVHNTIYFDESLLKSYDKDKNLTIAKNPFTADAKPSKDSSSEPSYTFTFDFDTIITEIKNLPAYQLIQSMFKVAYNVPSGKSSTACLVKISDGAFLNLNFTGVPFNTDNISAKSDKNKLLLSISTKQATGIGDCDFKSILGELKLQDNLKQVLELKDYPIDCSRMAAPPSQTQPPVPGQMPPAQTESNSSSVTGVALMTKTDSELTNIKESINKLLIRMNDLTSKQTNTQGQSTAMNQKILVGAPGDKNVCGKGGIGLKSDGTIVSIQVPISLVMDEIMTPKMLEMYTSSNRQQASQKPSGPAASALPSGPAADDQSGNISANSNASSNVQNLNAQPGNGAQPGSSGQPSVIELDAAKKDALQAAKGKLGELTTKLTTASITPLPAGVEALQNAVEAAEQAVTAFGNAAADDKNAAKPSVDENAATIQALTDKLKKEATDVLDAAKIAYAAISPAPTPTIAFTTEHGLITTATAAITTATSADAAGKAAAIATATTAVESAIAAAKAADVAVKAAAVAAAGKPAPPSGTGADYTAYETAYTAYDAAKTQFESSLSDAEKLHSDFVNIPADGSPPIQSDVDAAKLRLKKVIDSAKSDTSDSLVTIKSEKSILGNDVFKAFSSKEKTEEVDNLQSNTGAYQKNFSIIQGELGIYNDKIKPGGGGSPMPSSSSSAPVMGADYAAYESAYKAYDTAKTNFDAALQNAQEIYTRVGTRASPEVTQAKDMLKAHVQAIQIPADIDKLSSDDFSKLNDDNTRQAAVTAVKDATAKYIKDNAQIDSYIATYDTTTTAPAAKSADSEEEEEEAAFSLFDGGSTKSKSNSKSKSASKSKPKNKTKKNHHSKSNPSPNPNKSKTPKIKMNE